MTDPPRIAVVTCLRDEGPYVVEWVAHLRAIGVTSILAYTNDCTDGTGALLEALAPEGVIHVPQGDIRGARGPAPQWRALRAAWDHPAVTGADWLACLDCDEFPALADGDLPSLVAACGDAQAIALPWRLFGWSGQVSAGEDPTPRRFDRSAPEGMAFPAQGSFFKTLFRRDGPFTAFGVHRPRQSGPVRFVDDRGAPASDLGAAEGRIILWRPGAPAGGRRVQLNHYSLRSAEEFVLKCGRGLPNRRSKQVDLSYWVERNFNQATCDRISPHLPALEAGMARLRRLPGVAQAEAETRIAQSRRLAEILATPDGARLLGRLILAGGSTPPPPGLGRRLLTLYRDAQEGGS